ncbi:MAG: hypothetical protein GX117_12940 [Candidatus Hydrogenedentes bacterium]|nr:hypothetical protein [Candidatus Hydrogenedentota bacterium]
MSKKILLTLMLCFAMILVAACQPEPPPPPPEPEIPPEPTPAEYHQQLRSVMGDLLMSGIAAPHDSLIPDMITQLQGRRTQLLTTDNGREALNMITRDVDAALKVSRDEERWRKIAILCRIYMVFQPDNNRYEKTREYAELMLKRPILTVTGFIELDNDLYVFIDLFDPNDGEVTAYRVREGEEFLNVMRIVKIIGNQQAIEVEYLPLHYTWECVGPKLRDKVGPDRKVER